MHGLQHAYLVLDLVDFGQGTLPHIDTLCLQCGPQCQEFLNLLQGEPELLGTLDKLDPPYCLCEIQAVVRPAARWACDQPLPLIVAQGFDMDCRALGHLAYGESLHLVTSCVKDTPCR